MDKQLLEKQDQSYCQIAVERQLLHHYQMRNVAKELVGNIMVLQSSNITILGKLITTIRLNDLRWTVSYKNHPDRPLLMQEEYQHDKCKFHESRRTKFLL